MKPANFPGCKEARRIAVYVRQNPLQDGTTAREIHEGLVIYGDDKRQQLEHAKTIQTKKDRRSLSMYGRIT